MTQDPYDPTAPPDGRMTGASPRPPGPPAPTAFGTGSTAADDALGDNEPHVDRFADDPRSLADIAGDVLDNASTLIRQEVELAKAEASQMATRAGKGAGMFGGAGVAGHMALLFASLAAWWGIGVLIGTAAQPALGWSGLILAVLYAGVALVLVGMGRSEIKRIKGLPRTAETVSKIPNAATGNEEENR